MLGLHFTCVYLVHFNSQALRQFHAIVLGLDVLGNPYGLLTDLQEGVKDFFYEPYQVIDYYNCCCCRHHYHHHDHDHHHRYHHHHHHHRRRQHHHHHHLNRRRHHHHHLHRRHHHHLHRRRHHYHLHRRHHHHHHLHRHHHHHDDHYHDHLIIIVIIYDLMIINHRLIINLMIVEFFFSFTGNRLRSSGVRLRYCPRS